MGVVRYFDIIQDLVGIPHVKRVYNRKLLVLIVDFHSTVEIKVALDEVLIKERGDILPLLGCDSWGYQHNEEFVLNGALDFGFFGQQLAVINK